MLTTRGTNSSMENEPQRLKCLIMDRLIEERKSG